MDGELQSFRKGSAIVAVESGADAIPVGITGTGQVWGRGSKRIHLSPVSVRCGEPLRPLPGEDYEAFNRRMLDAVRELVR